MGNLGPYEVITTAAKAAGGVDAWLGAIKKASFTKGATAGAVGGGLVVGGVIVVASRLREAQKAREERAATAEQELRALLKKPTDPKDS
ncbi:hypothetical protein [Streptomyces sp. NPDC048489]|uniref:hypothetical protein n=1 Tax=Streptomyces sp. NPDC048489 TaxID=3154504 RepID=UPI00344A10E4